MPIKYLLKEQAFQQLIAGRAIEQWLGHLNYEDYRIIKWLRIDREETSEYSVTYFEVFDEGSNDFLDIYEFSPLDPDKYYGEISTFNTKEMALDYSINYYKADVEKFVGNGLIQDVYADFLEHEGLPS